jgi:hypothetical protein
MEIRGFYDESMLEEMNGLLDLIPVKPKGVPEAYTVDQLEDSLFLFDVIASFGYSLSLVHMSNDKLDEERAKNDMPPHENRDSYPHGLYSYGLLGKRYETRGNHQCPLSPHPYVALITALFNIMRLEIEDQTGAIPDPEIPLEL